MVQWFSGFNVSMVQWFTGSMVQWFNGSVAQWFNGSVAQWFNGSMEFHRGKPLVQWFNGSVVQRFNGSLDFQRGETIGSMVLWLSASVVQWFNGSMVQWFHSLFRNIPWVSKHTFGSLNSTVYKYISCNTLSMPIFKLWKGHAPKLAGQTK